MAFTAELHVVEYVLSVSEFHWALVQSVDEYSRPQGFVYGGQLHLVLDHLHHPVLDSWMADPQMLLDGSLVVKGLDGSVFRTVAFREAFCASEGLHFNGTGLGHATSLSVLISAKHLLIDGDVEFNNA